jgi:hypothetical protein
MKITKFIITFLIVDLTFYLILPIIISGDANVRNAFFIAFQPLLLMSVFTNEAMLLSRKIYGNVRSPRAAERAWTDAGAYMKSLGFWRVLFRSVAAAAYIAFAFWFMFYWLHTSGIYK